MRDAFTLPELLVCTTVLGILVAITLGAVSSVREKANQTQCVANLRQWSVALNLFVAENDGSTPRRGQGVQPVWVIDRPEDWFNALPPYLGMESYSRQAEEGHPAKPGDHSVFVCPNAKQEADYAYTNFLCYGMNMYLSPWVRPAPHRIVELPNPSQLAFMADAPGGWASTIPSSQGYSVQARHQGNANVAFVDGHVKTFGGTYLGCGVGEPERDDIRWQTLSGGVNQSPMP